jgi:hypothetical protein
LIDTSAPFKPVPEKTDTDLSLSNKMKALQKFGKEFPKLTPGRLSLGKTTSAALIQKN